MSSTNSVSDSVSEVVAVSPATTTSESPAASRAGKPVGFVIAISIVIICAVGLFTSVSDAASGLWCIALMIALMFTGLPIPLSLAIASSLGIYYVSGTFALTNVLQTSAFTASSSWSMTVLPLFIFMGLLLTQAGLTQKMYRTTEM